MKCVRIGLPERLDLDRAVDIAAKLRNVKNSPAIVLSGSETSFCRGMDFGFATGAAEDESTQTRTRSGLCAFADCLELLLLAPRPTLAVVQGAALGGGLGLAAACDFVLAAETASFGLPEALYGFAPAIIRPALELRLSAQQINCLLFTGYARTAAEAAVMGLVDRLANSARMAQAEQNIVRQLARARSRGVQATRQWRAGAVRAAISSGIEETAAALRRDDVLRALRASSTGEELPWQT